MAMVVHVINCDGGGDNLALMVVLGSTGDGSGIVCKDACDVIIM